MTQALEEQYQKLENTIREYNPGADLARSRAPPDFFRKCHDNKNKKKKKFFFFCQPFGGGGQRWGRSRFQFSPSQPHPPP